MSCGSKNLEKKACCTPASNRISAGDVLSVNSDNTELHPAIAENMVSLPGGSFLMGTDYREAFPNDGEQPIRTVTLSPFSIDRYPVTNALFARFVSETGYITEAEQFG